MPTETPLANDPTARTPTGEIKDAAPPATTTPTPATTTTPTPEPATAEPSKTETKQTEPTAKPSLVNEKDDSAPAGAPEKYEPFKAPEGYEINDEVNTLFKELNLPQDAGQKLVDFYVKQAQEALEAPYKTWEETQSRWIEEVKADREIGTKLPQVKATIAKAIDGLGDAKLAADFRQAMDYTGAGNNPAFIKAFFKLASLVTEGSHVAGNGPSELGQRAPDAAPPSAARALYPNLP